jgi:hypothetical protein
MKKENYMMKNVIDESFLHKLPTILHTVTNGGPFSILFYNERNLMSEVKASLEGRGQPRVILFSDKCITLDVLKYLPIGYN